MPTVYPATHRRPRPAIPGRSTYWRMSGRPRPRWPAPSGTRSNAGFDVRRPGVAQRTWTGRGRHGPRWSTRGRSPPSTCGCGRFARKPVYRRGRRGAARHVSRGQVDRELAPDLCIRDRIETRGGPVCQNGLLARDRLLYQVRLVAFGPFLWRGTVAIGGIDVVTLHPPKRLLGAKVVTRAADTDPADRLERQRVVIHLDPAHAAQRLTDQVIAEDQAFVAETKQGGVHARRLVDHVQPRQPGHDVRAHLLPPGLHVWQLGIRSPRRGPAGQPVELVHLGATRGQQRLLARADGHGPRAQVEAEGPRAEDRRVPGADRVDIDKPGQAFGHRLHDGPRHRRGRGGPGHARRQQQNGHAAANAGLHYLAGFGGELHWWDDKTVRIADKGALAPLVLAARDQVQHFQGRADMCGIGERGADMFRGARTGGIDRVEVHFHVVGDIAADHGALHEMDIVEHVADPRGIVQILQGAFTVIAPFDIDDVHGRASGAVMHARALQQQVVARVAAVEGDLTVGAGQGVLDQCARKPDAPVLAKRGPGFGQAIDPALRGVGQPDLFKRVKRGLVDAQHALFGQGFVHAPFKTCTDWADGLVKRGGAAGAAGGPSSGAARDLFVHEMCPWCGKGMCRVQTRPGLPRAARPRSAPMVRMTSVILQRFAMLLLPVSGQERTGRMALSVPIATCVANGQVRSAGQPGRRSRASSLASVISLWIDASSRSSATVSATRTWPAAACPKLSPGMTAT